MKRTAEKVLTWIGFGFNILVFFGCILFTLLLTTSKEEFSKALMEENAFSLNEAGTIADIYTFMSMVGLVLTAIYFILCILAAVWIGKKNKAAGIILIVIGALSFISPNWIAGVLWLIAGIMLLVRKPKAYHSNLANDYNYNNDYTRSENRDQNDSGYERNLGENTSKKVDEDPYKY
ncbi:DUF4064 domain-containing protein [Staphylococcus sp. SQ8-PEA]|uniref:DUF4064 domain-containing protein n=1 Tax=Staphylococcus marylandisciuri TaxID=2981529 RepID=A0ABT2QQR2_9STAP|nr:DUF4064 domain-containing protein [Staphylococcus marylandisciuri]MCU5746311.1 DUF4064 domain-containing protein [Staphylococcus marylandisciuri]